MQISKSFLVLCAVAAGCAFGLPSRAADTEAQIKAREALEKKLQEMQGQPAPSNVQPIVVAPAPAAKPGPARAPAPVVTPTPATNTPKPADSEDIARAREALRPKLSESQT